MEVIVGVTPDWGKYRILNEEGEDISQFVWAADDEADLYVEFEHEGTAFIVTDFPDGDRIIRSFTKEGRIKLVKGVINDS